MKNTDSDLKKNTFDIKTVFPKNKKPPKEEDQFYIKPRFDNMPTAVKHIRIEAMALKKTLFVYPFDKEEAIHARETAFNNLCDLWVETQIFLSNQSQGYAGSNKYQEEAFYLTFSWINQILKSMDPRSKADVFKVVDMVEVYMLELLPVCADFIVGNRSKRAGKETYNLQLKELEYRRRETKGQLVQDAFTEPPNKRGFLPRKGSSQKKQDGYDLGK